MLESKRKKTNLSPHNPGLLVCKSGKAFHVFIKIRLKSHMVGSGQDAEDPDLSDIRRALLRIPSEDDDICLMQVAPKLETAK